LTHREPNAGYAEDDQTEKEMLLAELAYSPIFRVFIDEIVRPKVETLRDKLLRQEFLSEFERRGAVMCLLQLEQLLVDVFDHTEPQVLPTWVASFFR